MTDSETAYAKINLALHVRSRGADGYHAIESLFAFAQDGDLLTLADAPGLRIEGPFGGTLQGESDNLVTRAACAFAATFGTPERGMVLDKRLPIAAGIGGGSADAAAALRLLAQVEGIDLGDPRLFGIAAGLGADVPACLLSHPVRGTGRGDTLEGIDAAGLAGMPLLLVNPRLPVPTGPVYAGWDQVDRGPLALGDPLAVAQAARNDLQLPALAIAPGIADVLRLLAGQEGVILSRMSGSGATCFALFDGIEARDAASADISAAHPDWWQLPTRLRG